MSQGERSAPRASPLPDFVVIGAQKAGTTSLYHYLRAHPRIYVPRKELDFFCATPAPDVSQYADAFRDAPPDAVIGDVSPNYTLFPIFPAVPEQMAAAIPDARLVYVLRHPIERMVAGYLHAVASGWEDGPAREELHHGPYFVASLYGLQLQLFRRFFADEQILVVTSEDLRSQRDETLKRILEHIGVDPSQLPVDALDAEYHRTEVKRLPRSLLRRAGAARPVARLARRSPLAARVLTRPISAQRGIDDDVLEYARIRIQSDVRWLLEQRPELDGWGLAGTNPRRDER